MQHASDPTAPVVTRTPMREHFATEPDNTHLYIPKGQTDTTSMQKTRFQIPAEIYGPVHNHAVVALTTSANIVDRRRSYDQLIRMSDAGDEMAAIALSAIRGLVIELST
jgi:hypothetical protein